MAGCDEGIVSERRILDHFPRCVLGLGVPVRRPVNQREETPCPVQPVLPAGSLEHRDDILDRAYHDVFGLAFRRIVELHPRQGGRRVEGLVADGFGRLHSRGQQPVREHEFPQFTQGLAGLQEHSWPPRVVFWEQRRRALKEVRSRRHVAPSQGSVARRGQVAGPPNAQLPEAVVHGPQLNKDQVGLL